MKYIELIKEPLFSEKQIAKSCFNELSETLRSLEVIRKNFANIDPLDNMAMDVELLEYMTKKLLMRLESLQKLEEFKEAEKKQKEAQEAAELVLL